MVCLFFFFKQKTAYEMRISDWSSDVCSSDLLTGAGREHAGNQLEQGRFAGAVGTDDAQRFALAQRKRHVVQHLHHTPRRSPAQHIPQRVRAVTAMADHRVAFAQAGDRQQRLARSEEHTSELQSLMRISYDVFCLKKKNTN